MQTLAPQQKSSRIDTSRTMIRAVQLSGPGRIECVSVAKPRPGPREVLMRVQACGVCGSNLGPWAGAPWFSYPFEPGAPGHEGVGIVEAIGEEVDGICVGTRVAMLSQNAFAEFDRADVNAVLPLPPELTGSDFLGEPLGCALNVFKRSGVKAGDHVAVVGIGFLGAILVQLCRDAGATVITLDRRLYARRLAESLGAEALAFNEQSVRAAIEANGGELYDVVIEATGKAGPLAVSGELTRERGRLVIAGYHQDGPREINMQLWNWRGIDVINAHERDPKVYLSGMQDALRAVLERRIEVDRLITHRFPLDELGRALDLTRDRPDGFLKAVIEP